ncbi:MAG TPA: hypothetical protein VM939_10110 [Gemmatimonadaceae bacterium]|nr:hypothetical protein [Gemmatimonadaceae bacterium]
MQSELLSLPARALVRVLPPHRRDELVGDLMEEAATEIEPTSGRDEARRWILTQLVHATPHLVVRHFKREAEMDNAKLIGAAAIVGVGALQAWDSGILNAPIWVGAMVVLALTIAVTALFSTSGAVRLGAAITAFALVAAARILSPVHLPELTLIGLPIVLVLLIVPQFIAKSKSRQGPQPPAAQA